MRATNGTVRRFGVVVNVAILDAVAVGVAAGAYGVELFSRHERMPVQWLRLHELMHEAAVCLSARPVAALIRVVSPLEERAVGFGQVIGHRDRRATARHGLAHQLAKLCIRIARWIDDLPRTVFLGCGRHVFLPTSAVVASINAIRALLRSHASRAVLSALLLCVFTFVHGGFWGGATGRGGRR